MAYTNFSFQSLDILLLRKAEKINISQEILGKARICAGFLFLLVTETCYSMKCSVCIVSLLTHVVSNA